MYKLLCKSLLTYLVYALAFVATANAEVAENPEARLMPADLLGLKQLSDLVYSADRNAFAFVASSSGDEKGGEKAIWLHDLNRGETRRMTRQDGASDSPRWCPDGSCLGFLSGRNGATQILSLSMAGGEPEALTSADVGVDQFEWSPSGDRIAYVSDVSKEPVAGSSGIEKDELLRIVSRASQQISILDVSTRTVTPLLTGRWRVSSIRWMPDGQSLIVSASADVDSEIEYNRIYRLDLSSKAMTELLRPDREFDQLSVSPDGRHLAFLAVREVGPEMFDLFTLNFSTLDVRNLSAATIDRKLQSHAWVDNRTLLAIAETGFQTRMYEMKISGSARALPDLPVNPYYSLVAGQSLVAFLGSSFDRAPELWVAMGSRGFSQATRINDITALTGKLRKPELIEYESFDDQTIEAALFVPDSRQFAKPYPLVVAVHGGPSYRWSSQFNPSWSELLVSRGYAVLAPNIRGSTGYSYEFLMSNVGDLGGADFKDIMAGVDHVVNLGLADAGRVGIAGWSYGGYMAAWAVTQTDRFKVAVSGAPVTNWITEYGTETTSINRYDRELLGTPYDNTDRYISSSPVFGVRNVSTPTMLICAENDVIDPIAQCWEFHRGLQQNKVPTEFLIYKGVGHSRSRWSNWQREDSMHRMLDWIQKHL